LLKTAQTFSTKFLSPEALRSWPSRFTSKTIFFFLSNRDPEIRAELAEAEKRDQAIAVAVEAEGEKRNEAIVKNNEEVVRPMVKFIMKLMHCCNQTKVN
jgi:hypothetical protein